MQKFWMVWNEATGQTRVRHDTTHSARQEAERLARANPAQRFFVLGSEGFAVKRDVDWHNVANGTDIMCEDELPF